MTACGASGGGDAGWLGEGSLGSAMATLVGAPTCVTLRSHAARCPVAMQTLLRCGLLERLAMTARQRLIPNLAGGQHRGVGRGPQRQLHR